MAKKNLQFGAAMLVISIFTYICTFSIKITGEYAVSSAAFFPRLIIGLMAILSIILLTQGIKDLKKSSEEIEKAEEKNYKLLFTTILTFIGFGVAVDMVGFIISSMVYLVAQIWFMDEVKNKKSLIKYGIIAICVSLFIYFSFTYAFYVSLPSGKLF